MATIINIEIPMKTVVTSNRDNTHWRKGRLRKFWAQAIPVKPCKPYGKASIHIFIYKRTSTIYDPLNLADTFKSCIDQLVDLKIIDDDSYKYVAGPYIHHGGVDRDIPKGFMRARIIITEYKPVREKDLL